MAITVVGEFAVFSGYASMNEYLVLGMHRAGARLNLQPQYMDTRGCSADLLELWARSRPHVDGPVLYASWMQPDLACLERTELYIRSMYEASKLPAAWPARLNTGRVIIVPSSFAAAAFRASGVTVPIEIVPDGIDPQAYPCMHRAQREGVTTLVVSAVYNRLSGLPVIALASEGQGDVCREAADLVLAVQPAGWEPHLHDGREECGVRGVPGVADVAARLRWVAAHRDEAAEMGRAASDWVHANRNVWSYGPAVLAIMEHYTRYRRGRGRRRERAPWGFAVTWLW